MKNTLDWLYSKHVKGKVFGLMSTLGGIENSNTLNHMRISLRWLHAWPVPEQLAIGKVKEAFDEDGNLISEDHKERLAKLVKSVLDTTKTFFSRCDICPSLDLKMNSVEHTY